jgi:hypothetical protein
LLPAVLALASGCAVVTPTTAPPTPAPGATTATKEHEAAPVPVGSTASGGTISSGGPAAAVVDSGPSAEAVAVLATIPEPIPAADRVPPPDHVMRDYPLVPAGVAAGGIAATSAGSSAAPTPGSAPADAAPIPVPAAVVPLGQRERRTAVSDSAMRAAMGDTVAAKPVHPDSCWRVQFAAPVDEAHAEQLRGAAESLLLLPIVVEREEPYYKVRTRDCMSGQAADRTRRRADQSGFAGAFRFRQVPKR